MARFLGKLLRHFGQDLAESGARARTTVTEAARELDMYHHQLERHFSRVATAIGLFKAISTYVSVIGIACILVVLGSG